MVDNMKSNFKAMNLKIGKTFEIVRAEGYIHNDPHDRIPIVLGAGRAFGSGEHETTWSCLEAMEGIPIFNGASVLDVGCGTGILSIAAARLGADRVIAFDPDADAVVSTENNVKLNHLERTITLIEGELESVPALNFDIILANLYGDILVKLFEDLFNRLNMGGYMLFSGILFEYAFDLKRAFSKAGIELLKARYLEEYVTLLGLKRKLA